MKTQRNHTYRGITILPGAYQGTNDSHLGEWYPQLDPRGINRIGNGYRTLADAKLAIDEHFAATLQDELDR